jgi:hypothetical protein
VFLSFQAWFRKEIKTGVRPAICDSRIQTIMRSGRIAGLTPVWFSGLMMGGVSVSLCRKGRNQKWFRKRKLSEVTSAMALPRRCAASLRLAESRASLFPGLRPARRS